jgi:hypothetical protein
MKANTLKNLLSLLLIFAGTTVFAQKPAETTPQTKSANATAFDCGTPTGLDYYPLECSFMVHLQWNAVPGAISYLIEKRRTNVATWTVVEG